MSEPTPSRPALATRYLGLELSGPVIASAGPRTGRIDELMLLEDAGAAAVVLPSLFEEEVIAEEMAFFEAQEQGAGMVAEFTSIMPEVDMPDLGPERHLRLLEEAKERLDIPVIASVNAVHTGSWSRYTSMMVEAGADAIELNLYAVAANAAETALEVENRYLDVIREVRQSVGVPLAVKLSPFYSSLSHFAMQVIDNGADGLVLFNRFYAPDLDLDTLEVTPRVALSSPVELRMPLRWLGILRNQLPNASLAATTRGALLRRCPQGAARRRRCRVHDVGGRARRRRRHPADARGCGVLDGRARVHRRRPAARQRERRGRRGPVGVRAQPVHLGHHLALAQGLTGPVRSGRAAPRHVDMVVA